MPTQTIHAIDGLHIAYDIQGYGIPLILLHGFSNDRRMWHRYGVISALEEDFTVITLDLRGCGQSQGSGDAGAYKVDFYLNDILRVADACEVETFAVWGWSFGGTLACHLSTHTPRLTRVVAAGTYFGQIFTSQWVKQRLVTTIPLALAKHAGELDHLQLSDDARRFAEETDFDVMIARIEALQDWPTVDPEEVRRPMLLYSGTEDRVVLNNLDQQHAAIQAAGIDLLVYDGLDHVGLVSDLAAVYPNIYKFLTT